MKFEIRFWPALLVLIVAAVTVRLGFWQLDRGRQREALQARVESHAREPAIVLGAKLTPLAAVEFRRVVARGHFVPGLTVYLDNRPYQDQPGFYVVTPLALDNGGFVLVNRGWLPRDSSDRTSITPYRTPSRELEITGVARADPGRAFEFAHGSDVGQKIRQNLSVSEYAKETGLPLRPFVIQQTSDSGDGLVRDWPMPATGAARNYGYMAQWWSIAGAALVFGLYAARPSARRRYVPPRETLDK